jgi:hypothetical protein
VESLILPNTFSFGRFTPLELDGAEPTLTATPLPHPAIQPLPECLGDGRLMEFSAIYGARFCSAGIYAGAGADVL